MRRPSSSSISVSATLAAGALFIQKRRTASRLERLGGAALETLLNAIDANDPVTGAHVRRVARYALILAESAGLDAHTCHSIERAALFHDIGKIHEALFDVIHDSTTLTPAERRAIKTHPDRGAEVLAPLAPFYPELPQAVRAHHERWDGTGYPRGLKGKRIPFVSRIVAIADTFDAVTYSRRYSRGRSFASASGVIMAGRGRQFDPELVDLFMSVPVLKQFHDTMDQMHRERQRSRHARKTTTDHASRERRSPRGTRLPAPDVTFRWRDTTPPQPPPDRHSQKSPQ